MKKFINSIIAFCILMLCLYFAIFIIVKPKKNILINDYMAAMIDKHRRVNQLNCPKIIFSGGSNLAFGLNSEEVERELSIPVVNLGLHAGLGLSFILNELKYTIRSGDIVFLSIEYFLETDGDYKLLKNTSDNYKEAEKYYSFNLINEILIHVDKTRSYVKSYKINEKSIHSLSAKKQVYSREAFNKYGDVLAHLDKIPPNDLGDRGLLNYRYWDGISELNEFYNYAKKKKVSVFFIYPNYPTTEFVKNKVAIDKLSMDLTNNLEIEILNKPSDFVFSDNLFFDTVYHLNKKGRELRTKRLIDLLKKSANIQQVFCKKNSS